MPLHAASHAAPQGQRCNRPRPRNRALPACRLRLGEPLAALPLLHYVLLDFSRHVRAYALSCNVQVGWLLSQAATRAAAL